ncbi:MAG: tyrosine--tRNA ligase, partial [Bacteroidales bacterium]|nr:tyrosine--tRNA ligase [Bacteroidales bacterium]
TLKENQQAIYYQLLKFLDFDKKRDNYAEIVNNYDWTKDFSFLGFLREIGKHITVNYMIAKDSVKKRLDGGISFTEFSYQLLQAYDFLWLYRNKQCKLQMGGSDQWGNITTGTELIRRVEQGEAFALTCPLITKADGGKFGKTEEGNVWLDPEKTSPYKFYQFWLNTSDEDAERFIKIFTLFSKDEVEELVARHKEAPHERVLQNALAEHLTIMVHSEKDFNASVQASQILFGKGTTEMLRNLPENILTALFEGVPVFEINEALPEEGIMVVDFLAEKTKIFPSKSDARRTLKDNGVAINKRKINEHFIVSKKDLIKNKYILVQRGKKSYFLVIVRS